MRKNNLIEHEARARVEEMGRPVATAKDFQTNDMLYYPERPDLGLFTVRNKAIQNGAMIMRAFSWKEGTDIKINWDAWGQPFYFAYHDSVSDVDRLFSFAKTTVLHTEIWDKATSFESCVACGEWCAECNCPFCTNKREQKKGNRKLPELSEFQNIIKI